jgi:hypothetical protein
MPGRWTPAMPPYSVSRASSALTSVRPGARRRMDDQPGRLVDDQQVVVLVDDGERDRLGLQLERRGSGISSSTISPGTIGSLALTGLPAAVTWPSVMSFWT